MSRKILVADLLCGAGGSSTGCGRALAELGLKMELVCVNHWGVAIETHKKNHPEARHYCQDIATVRPHQIVPEGYLDLLMASPTCTHHSVARGGKPTSDQQRSDPWHIITWLTELRVKRIIIENVWEFCGWGPVDARTGRPIASRKGEYFRAWIDTIRRFGFDPEWRKLNAADFGDATTRQRFILMARSDRKAVAWPVPTHRKREEGRLELFPTMQPWRPAREIIDWELKGRSIFSRKKPLAEKTLARIYAGAKKFGWPEPFLVILRQHMAGLSIDGPLPTIAANGGHIGLAEPVVVNMKGQSTATGIDAPLPTLTAGSGHAYVAEPIILANRTNNAPKSVDDPAPVFTTAHGGGVAVAEPVIVNGRRGNKAKGVSTDPVPALDTKGGVWLAEPLILSQHNSGAPRSTDDPLPTVTTGGAGTEERPGCGRPMLVEPFITTVAHGNDAGDPMADSRRSHSVEQPLGTLHAGGGKFGVVEPFILSRQSEGAPRSVGDPIPTQQTVHSPVLIAPYYGSGSGETCRSAEEPLASVTTRDRFGMVVPVTHSKSGNGARSVEEPVPTMTTAKGGEFAIVMPVTHADASDRTRDADEPLPTVTGANRGELAVITAQHGERDGQAPRVHDVEEPTPTIAASGHIDLVEGRVDVVDGAPRYDILFRMLEPHELAAAMGFSDEEAHYEFAGTKTEQIRQIGNAVSVAKMKACVGTIMADAAPRRMPKAEPRAGEPLAAAGGG